MVLLSVLLDRKWIKQLATTQLHKVQPIGKTIEIFNFFIGPESDHWLCLSVTDSLTDCCLVDLIDVTLVCEDANSKLVEVVTVADVDAEKRVDDSLVQIWKLKFGFIVKILFRL